MMTGGIGLALGCTLLPFVGTAFGGTNQSAVRGSLLQVLVVPCYYHNNCRLTTTNTKTQIKGWYRELKKPWFTPPNWAFPLVWTSLYASMGYASYRIGIRAGFSSTPWAWYVTQLLLNWAWSPLFFRWRRIRLATAEICVMWVCIAITGLEFMAVDRLSGWLMVPYLAWVTLASALSISICLLNPTFSSDVTAESTATLTGTKKSH